MLIERVGKVIFWVGCLAALQFGVAALVALRGEKPSSAVSFALISFNCWVWGWLLKYIATEFRRPARRGFAADVGWPAPRAPFIQSAGALRSPEQVEMEFTEASKMLNQDHVQRI
jgi:hypothetical protein